LRKSKICDDYVFETSLLSELSFKNKIVEEVPGPMIYKHEHSSLKPMRLVLPLLRHHLYIFFRRLLFTYFFREFNVGTVFLITGIVAGIISTGVAYDGFSQAAISGRPAASGIVGMSILLAIVSYISFVGFIFYDISINPNRMSQQRIIKWLFKNEKIATHNRK
jgi:hypothetical protein